MATSSPRILPDQGRSYRGYPFGNPVVIDVPALDEGTAEKWAYLPRRPIATSAQRNTQPKTFRSNGFTKEKDDVAVVYIELPDDTDDNGYAISRNQEDRGQENPAFVQETIFFDPFENRQIYVNQSQDSPKRHNVSGAQQPSSNSPAASSPTTLLPNVRIKPKRPPPPINLHSPGSHGAPSSSTVGGLPRLTNQESQLYGSSGSTEDGLTLTPLPVRDYPEPPPAYTVIAGANNNQLNQATPPRTVVVGPVPTPTVGLPSSNRKFVQCQNCSLRVHTVVMKENGLFTHAVALITMIFCLLPITVLIYCTDFFKYQVHFCPNCNHRIGYEIPIIYQSMVYY